MRADVRVAGSMSGRTLRGIGCMFCGRQDVSEFDVAVALSGGPVALCGRCRRELRPTPLDVVLDAIGWTAVQFAEATGIPLRTVVRAAKGMRMGKAAARRLSKVTGMPAATWRGDTESM